MSLPKIQIALDGWEIEISLIKVTQTIVDFQAVNIEEIITFKGVVQPLEAEKLKQKPIETRSWEWLQIHVREEAQIDLETNDLIEFDGKRYRIKDKWNYKRYGYNEYDCVATYK